jgi:hypothetical protein
MVTFWKEEPASAIGMRPASATFVQIPVVGDEERGEIRGVGVDLAVESHHLPHLVGERLHPR